MNHTNQPTEHQEILKQFDLPALALLTPPLSTTFAHLAATRKLTAAIAALPANPPLNTIFACTGVVRQIAAAPDYQEAYAHYQAAIKRCTIRTGQDMLQRAIMARRDHPMRGR